MTDPETADKTYIGPMTPEVVAEIIEKVSCFGMHAIRRWHRTTFTKGVESALVSRLSRCSTGAARCGAAHHGRTDGAEPGQGAVRGALSWPVHT